MNCHNSKFKVEEEKKKKIVKDNAKQRRMAKRR